MQKRIVLLIDLLISDNFSPVPFKNDDRNDSYLHLLQVMHASGCEMWVTHFNNINNDGGLFYWAADGGQWQMHVGHMDNVLLAYAELPPHYERSMEVRELLASWQIPVLNDLEMLDMATDKYSSYEMFAGDTPCTLSTDAADLAKRVQEMRTMQLKHSDLSAATLFLKPRYGMWAEGIHVLHEDTALPEIEGPHVLQLFMESGNGVPEIGINSRHDMRLLIYNGEVFQFKVKVPQAGTYISNTQHRGELMYFELEQLPQYIKDFAKQIDSRLTHFHPRLYSLDIGIGLSGRIWIYELNTMPGLAWNSKNPPSVDKAKQCHHVVTAMLSAKAAQLMSELALVSDTISAA